MAARKAEVSFEWLSVNEEAEVISGSLSCPEESVINGYVLTNDCHSHAVRESRARLWSDCRRSSPASADSTSPWLPPVPGKSVPRSWTSMNNCESNWEGVESKGVPGIDGSTWSAAAMVCLCTVSVDS